MSETEPPAGEELEPVAAPALTFITLPSECQTMCLSWLSLADLGSAAATCQDLHNAAVDPALWQSLLRTVWHVPTPLPEGDDARTKFIERFRNYSLVCDHFDVAYGLKYFTSNLNGRQVSVETLRSNHRPHHHVAAQEDPPNPT